MKLSPLFVSTSLLMLGAFTQQAFAAQPKVLMVLSSNGEKDASEQLVKPGFEMDELSKAYLVFKQHGVDVTLTSPKGGHPIADNFNPDKPYNKRFMDDEHATTKLQNTLPISKVNATDYSAVFVVGGKGPMFDLADNHSLQTIIKTVYENNGHIGAVCHGPAALVNVKLSTGEWLVANKRISGFTLEEEAAFSKKWAKEFPFQLETKLKDQGALFVQDGLMLNQVSIDGRLITGQNPFSTTDTAKALVSALGVSLQTTQPFQDDATILLVERYFADMNAASNTYLKHVEQYDTMLLAMFGFYQAQHANTELERNVAIKIMEDTHKAVKHPMLVLGLANAYEANGQAQQAKKLLLLASSEFPDDAQIKAKLQAL